MASKEKKLAVKTNTSIKQKVDEGVNPLEIQSYIFEELWPKYNELFEACGEKEVVERSNEDFATILEWMAILEHRLHENQNPNGCSLCYTYANAAHCFRLHVMCAKNPDLYYPILGERFVAVEQDFVKAIECYKKAGNDHKERLNELMRKAEDLSKEKEKELIGLCEKDEATKKKKKKKTSKSKDPRSHNQKQR